MSSPPTAPTTKISTVRGLWARGVKSVIAHPDRARIRARAPTLGRRADFACCTSSAASGCAWERRADCTSPSCISVAGVCQRLRARVMQQVLTTLQRQWMGVRGLTNDRLPSRPASCVPLAGLPADQTKGAGISKAPPSGGEALEWAARAANIVMRRWAGGRSPRAPSTYSLPALALWPTDTVWPSSRACFAGGVAAVDLPGAQPGRIAPDRRAATTGLHRQRATGQIADVATGTPNASGRREHFFPRRFCVRRKGAMSDEVGGPDRGSR